MVQDASWAFVESPPQYGIALSKQSFIDPGIAAQFKAARFAQPLVDFGIAAIIENARLARPSIDPFLAGKDLNPHSPKVTNPTDEAQDYLLRPARWIRG
jgi:hypothetical protein